MYAAARMQDAAGDAVGGNGETATVMDTRSGRQHNDLKLDGRPSVRPSGGDCGSQMSTSVKASSCSE